MHRPDVAECLRAEIAREGRCLILPQAPPPALGLLGATGADQPALCRGVGALRPEAEIEVVRFRAGERVNSRVSVLVDRAILKPDLASKTIGNGLRKTLPTVGYSSNRRWKKRNPNWRIFTLVRQNSLVSY